MYGAGEPLYVTFCNDKLWTGVNYVVTFILTNVQIFSCFLLTRNQQHSRFRRELYSVVNVLLVSFQWPRAVVTVGVGWPSGDVFFSPLHSSFPFGHKWKQQHIMLCFEEINQLILFWDCSELNYLSHPKFYHYTSKEYLSFIAIHNYIS